MKSTLFFGLISAATALAMPPVAPIESSIPSPAKSSGSSSSGISCGNGLSPAYCAPGAVLCTVLELANVGSSDSQANACCNNTQGDGINVQAANCPATLA